MEACSQFLLLAFYKILFKIILFHINSIYSNIGKVSLNYLDEFDVSKLKEEDMPMV